MSRFASAFLPLLIAGAAFASDYEMRVYQISIPIDEEVRKAIDPHLSKPLDTLVPELERIPMGLQPLAVLDQNGWDGSDLAGLPGVAGDQNPMPMSQGAAFYSGTEIPYEYLEPRSDGRFERKIGYVDRGIRLTLTSREPHQTRVWITLARPGPRKPIDGVTLDVGPVTQGDGPVWTNLPMNTPIGKWSVALFAMREELEAPPKLLLLFLRQLREVAEIDPNPISENMVAPIQFSVEAKFLHLPYEPVMEGMLFDKNGERTTIRESILIRDTNAVPVAGKGQRITAIKLPDSDQPIPVSDFDWERFRTAYPDDEPELLSAPRVTTMAGLTDRENPSNTLFKIVLPNGPTNPLGRIFDKDRFGGSDPGSGGFGGGGFGDGGSGSGGFDGGGQKSAEPIRDLVTLFDDLSPLVGDVVRSEGPGKPAVIADVMTQKIKVADEAGKALDGDEVYTGISVALKITCNSMGEDILLDVALVEIYLDWPPAIKLTRKGSPARPTPVEYSVPDATTLPRRIERSCRFRQPVENGETLAYFLSDDVRDDLTLVFVTIERVEGGSAFFYTEPKP
jgi:hypothetical protein